MIPHQSRFWSSLCVVVPCSGGLSIAVSGDHRALFKFTGPRHWLALVHKKHSPLSPSNTVPNPLSQIIGCYRLIAPPSFGPTPPTLDPNYNQSFLPDHVIDSSTSSEESLLTSFLRTPQISWQVWIRRMVRWPRRIPHLNPCPNSLSVSVTNLWTLPSVLLQQQKPSGLCKRLIDTRISWEM